MKFEEFERILDSYGVKYKNFNSDLLLYYRYNLGNEEVNTSAHFIYSCPIREYIDKIFNRWLEAEETIYK